MTVSHLQGVAGGRVHLAGVAVAAGGHLVVGGVEAAGGPAAVGAAAVVADSRSHPLLREFRVVVDQYVGICLWQCDQLQQGDQSSGNNVNADLQNHPKINAP
jgi:hypothetical protein